MRSITLLILLIPTIMLPVAAEETRPVIPAVQASAPPVLDGDLSDPCWQEAPSVTDFYHPDSGSKATEPTTVWLCYDQESIYLAFYCKDSQPEKITAQQKKRGGDIDSDDWVGFDLDRYGTYDRIIWFDVSAGGVQLEHLESGDASKIEWRGDWQAEAKIVDDGYIVELAVPFSIFQYDPSRTSMGIAFIRRHARCDRWWWSPNVGPDIDERQFYLWEGLELPKPERKPLMLAYSLLGAGEHDSPKRIGLDIKHSITPTATGLLTFNPDFRNVEQQVDSVDFTYTERWLSDSRPFFQEGSGYFPGSDVFYTRRIGQIDYGGKVAGKFGDMDIGLMHAAHGSDEDYTVFRASHSWPSKAYFQASAVQSNAPGTDNFVTHINGMYRLYDRNDRRMEVVATLSTADAASGSGNGQRWEYGLFCHARPRVLSWQIVHQTVEPDYDPYLSWWSEKGIDGWHFDASIYDEPAEGRISWWSAGLSAKAVDNLDGSLYRNSLSASANLGWPNGKGVWLNLSTEHRPPNHDRTARAGYWWGGNDLYSNGGVSVGYGKLAGGRYLYYSASQGWQLSDKLSMRASYEHARIKPPSPDAFSSGQLVTTLAYDIDNERTLAGRLISQEGNTNFYLAYKQRVRSGMDIYVIFGDPNAESTTSSLLVKLIRPL